MRRLSRRERRERRNGYHLLDRVFYFLPRPIQWASRVVGVYDAILTGRAKDSAELYEAMPRWMLRFQDADYSRIAADLTARLTTRFNVEGGVTRGSEAYAGADRSSRSILQIGCGRGDLLYHVASAADGLRPWTIVGIDRTWGMVAAARRRTASFDRVTILQDQAETVELAAFAPLDAVVLNNFWGLLPPEISRDLLRRIRSVLTVDGCVVIGPVRSVDVPEDARRAGVEVLERYGFQMRYPVFLDFAACGLSEEMADFGGYDYRILTPV